uniref:Odorant receptor, family 42, subfamily B, member 2 n=1 Tax=Hippocampus comes TaxID=109280 RepID=A0A3Q3DY97_HIPCM
MNLFNPAKDENVSMVHPEYFIISGLSGIPHIKLYYVFLFVVYVLSVLANGSVMAVICLDRRLRTPKYVAVFNLAFVDLFGSSALVPKLLDVFLLGHRRVPFRSCLTFLFFCYTCLSMQSFNLVALAYDRLLAIIFPLHYQVRSRNPRLMRISALHSYSTNAILTTMLSIVYGVVFCRTRSYFCDHGQIYRLACNSHYPNYVVSCVYPVVIFWLPLAFILLSYVAIGCTLAKVAAVQERLKALRTCAAHLSLVAIYFIPLLITFTLMENIHPDGRIVNLSLTSVFPPVLNPVIYTLQTQEIKDFFNITSLSRGFHQQNDSLPNMTMYSFCM